MRREWVHDIQQIVFELDDDLSLRIVDRAAERGEPVPVFLHGVLCRALNREVGPCQ